LKLKDEMTSLYKTEKKRDTVIFSSYFQSLAELMLTVKEAGAPFLPSKKAIDMDFNPVLPSLMPSL
jgi:hypothetical protein